MKPELRKALDDEIASSSTEMQEFLKGQYFRDTLSLIERVNKLDADQAVSLELEITMYLLGISDYPTIEEALRGELGQNGQVANEATVRQAVKDIESYIVSKAPSLKDTKIKTVTVSPEPKTTETDISTNLHEAIYKELEVKTEKLIIIPSPSLVEEEKPLDTPVAKPLDFYREKVIDEDKKVKAE